MSKKGKNYGDNSLLEDQNYSENKYEEVMQELRNSGNNRYGVSNGNNNNRYNTTGSTTISSNHEDNSYFDGGVLQLIGWRILTAILTGITFGLAFPWAKCMMLSWEYKHTVYDGKRLKFEGTCGSLFVNMLKWILLSIVTLGIYLIFVPTKMEKWIVSKLHFENESYGMGDSFFDGKVLELIGVHIAICVLTASSLGILYPYSVCYKLRWYSRYTVINGSRLIFTGKALDLFGNYIKWFFLTLITFGIYGFWVPIKYLQWEKKYSY